jgi:serine/threonine protein kinase
MDSFKAIEPDGTHIWLVYKPIRESLRLFRRHFIYGRLPLPLLKGYLQILLMGLDYLHSECQIIHTGEFGSLLNTMEYKAYLTIHDLRLDNVLVGFEDPSVIEDFVQGQAEILWLKKR